MEQKRAEDPSLSVEDLDQMITTRFVDWFKKTVNNYFHSHLSCSPNY
jgi:hypothetical protein